MIKNITLLISVRGEERRPSLIKLLQFAHMGFMKNHFKVHTFIIEQDKAPHYRNVADMFQLFIGEIGLRPLKMNWTTCDTLVLMATSKLRMKTRSSANSLPP